MLKREILKAFRGRTIIVIGDFMLDEYIKGRVERISPEAPVPVVEADTVEYKPGGAANVVANLVSLGARVIPVGVIGTDTAGEKLLELLRCKSVETSFIEADPTRLTTRKVRIIGASQQLLRVDWENRDYIPPSTVKKVLNSLKELAGESDAIIISDYGKGVVTPELFELTGKLKRKMPVLLDPKEKNFPIYKNLTAMTPNIKETIQAIGIDPTTDEGAERAGKKLIEKFNLDFAVITRSEAGLSVIGKNFKKHIPTRAKQVFDVTGAGDTVISAFTLSLCAGATVEEAGEIANIAAGIVVGKLGTATVTVEEIEEYALQNL